MSNVGNFYDARSPNMAMSRDPRSKFGKNYFFLFLHLILGKVTKLLVEKLSTSEIISQKPHGGGGGGWKTPPSAFRVKTLQLSSKKYSTPAQTYSLVIYTVRSGSLSVATT